VQFVLSAEQEELREVARAYFEQAMPIDQAVPRTGLAQDGSGWEDIVARLGVNTILVPDDLGGGGGDFLDFAMVVEEAGRALADLPLVGHAMAVAALRSLCDADADGIGRRLLGRIAESSARPTVVLGDIGAELANGVWALRGSATSVPDLAEADVLLVRAMTADGPAFFEVTSPTAGLLARPVETLDPTRRFGDLELDGAPGELVGPDPDAAVSRQAEAAGRAVLALDAVGGARKALEIAVDYARGREQFGHPIGTFQAIKHKCADMLLKVESATSAAEAAAWTLGSGAGGAAAEQATVLAKAYAAEAYLAVAAELIQILGGVGFTWEHPAHLFFKRAKVSALLLGAPEELRRAEADRLDLLPSTL